MPPHPTLLLASDYLQRAEAILAWDDPSSARVRLIIRCALACLEHDRGTDGGGDINEAASGLRWLEGMVGSPAYRE